MWLHTKESQEKITPEIALRYLNEGNQKFLNNLKINGIYYNRLTKHPKPSFHLLRF